MFTSIKTTVFTLFIIMKVLNFVSGQQSDESILQNSKFCQLPEMDILLIADSTANVGSANHRQEMTFLANFLDSLVVQNGSVNVALTQYTPEAKDEVEVTPLTRTVEEKIRATPFTPCNQCLSPTSINELVGQSFGPDSGNRAVVPDVVIIVQTSLYTLPELAQLELLIKPVSLTHAFVITVGTSAPSVLPKERLQFTATTLHLGAVDFSALQDLIYPLCESVKSVTGDLGPGTVKVGMPIVIFWIIIALLLFIAFVIIATLVIAVLKFRSETLRLNDTLNRERDRFKQIDEYYRSKIRAREAAQNEKEKTYMQMLQEAEKSKNFYQDQVAEAQTARVDKAENEKQREPDVGPGPSNNGQPQFQGILPIVGMPFAYNPNFGGPQQSFMMQNPGEIPNESPRKNVETEGESPRKKANIQVPPLERSDSEYEMDGFSDIPVAGTHRSHLTPDHPARLLPPVDVLLLVDSSSSIGNTLFEQVKQFLMDFTNDIDISPGRSRICLIQFAQEPQVFFGFDRFYSYRAVAKAISRMTYLGGSTYLAKALSFAAGVLYQEQNMKANARFRKLKYMPTPRHDRLQVMIVVSDGVSDDNYDKQATHLHEKMLVKIAGVVTRSFNRDKLIPITRFDGSVFYLDQQQALSIWLWRQQRMWNENFGGYIEREKSLQNFADGVASARPVKKKKKVKKNKEKDSSSK